jgi:threonine aldolase
VWAQDTALYSVRMVTHWNVNRAGIEKALVELQSIAGKKVGRSA